ncbi:MAG: AlpA family phage regulatory protein [Chromatiaceae bacterium]|nr:AlpA family phage regulatory protein [Chromatiaceae bacterium]MCF7994037.1 AlpA family phage regulatory protein [Chromatiaceae bacterium]MCF8016333.1 AlpA family phage regulatory protein [Chromatiaceae bacterium]
MSTRFLRLPAVMERTGFSRSAIYARASDGLFPRPVPLGLRTAAWPEHEVETVLQAHLREAGDTELREIVSELRLQRQQVQIAQRPSTPENPLPLAIGH